jgi:hypothetical protein
MNVAVLLHNEHFSLAHPLLKRFIYIWKRVKSHLTKQYGATVSLAKPQSLIDS